MFCSSKGLQQLKVFWFPLGSILIFQDSLNKAQRNESLDKNDQSCVYEVHWQPTHAYSSIHKFFDFSRFFDSRLILQQ
jgi:hypothetical protein